VRLSSPQFQSPQSPDPKSSTEHQLGITFPDENRRISQKILILSPVRDCLPMKIWTKFVHVSKVQKIIKVKTNFFYQISVVFD
jgi:hypothetical protein